MKARLVTDTFSGNRPALNPVKSCDCYRHSECQPRNRVRKTIAQKSKRKPCCGDSGYKDRHTENFPNRSVDDFLPGNVDLRHSILTLRINHPRYAARGAIDPKGPFFNCP